MPKVNYCPKCRKPMKRLYQKVGDMSSPYGAGWKCPGGHIWIDGFHPRIGAVLMLYESVPFSIIIDEWSQK